MPRTLAPRSDSPCLSHSPSVHYLCKSSNPALNACHRPRPEPPPTPVGPPATRALLPTVRAGPFPAAIPAPAAVLATSQVKEQRPGPAPRLSRRQHVPRPRQPAERQPPTPVRHWPPFPRPRHAQNPAKTHPAAPQEFLGRNSYCARDPGFHPLPLAPTAAEARPSQVRLFLPRPAHPPSRRYPRSSPCSLLFTQSFLGEGFPVNAPRVTPVVSAHRERPPNPARTHPAAPQEFLGRNSYCARGAPFPPNLRCRCRLSLRSTVTPESRS